MKIIFLVSLMASLIVSCEKDLLQKSTHRDRENTHPNSRISNMESDYSQIDKREWIAAEYFGFKLGKSTETDVKNVLGDPKFEGSNVEKVYKDSEDEILLQYNDVGDTKDAVDIIVGKQTKIVKAIAVYPNNIVTKQEAILKYGPDFFEIGSSESMCISKDRVPGESSRKLVYPIILVYPNRGFYILIKEDNRVNHYGYGMKCFDK